MASHWHWRYHFIFNLFEVLLNYIILFYIYTWILVVKSTLLMSLDVGKSRILTMRGLTKTRTKRKDTGSFRPRKWVDSPHLIAYMPTLERLKAVEGLGFATHPPRKLFFKRTQYSPKLWHFVICKYLYYSAHAQTQKYWVLWYTIRKKMVHSVAFWI